MSLLAPEPTRSASERTTLTNASATGVEDIVKLSTVDGDWATLRDLSLWLFHTPEGAVPALPPGIPVVAVLGG